jgi:hypothetical protein
MDTRHLFVGVLVAVLLVVYAFDRRNHRRAKNVRTAWSCFRCGLQLGPMESTEIRVAGSEFATTARACQRCAIRDKRIWWTGMDIITGTFAATVLVLWLL